MISLWLERLRKKAKKTVLGVEYDMATVSSVKLKKNENNEYELIAYETNDFPGEAYVDGNVSSVYIATHITDLIKFNKLKNTKLGFLVYKDNMVNCEDIFCDKKALEIISETSVSDYIQDYFLKKKYPETCSKIYFTYFDHVISESKIEVYYIPEISYMEKVNAISKAAKKTLAVCDIDTFAISRFVQELYFEEISKNKKESIFLDLYSDKICLYCFSSKGELIDYQLVQIFDLKINDTNYVDEVVQLLLRFIDFLALDVQGESFESTFNNQDKKVYIFGLKKGLNSIFESIKSLVELDCELLDPFLFVKKNSQNEIKDSYKYVMATAIAMREEL
ncbi:type IV pili [Pseudofrancisella aestuarii]|uniref:Type IV pili n=1 Tax=Pseudofrancisella aestuarii TaxID=2670347 RepID=A0ABV9T971_9GAMM|nr:type IV pili [Pseudofrancisella aestuarii]